MKTKKTMQKFTPDILRYKTISYGLQWDVWLLWEYENKILIYN